MATIDRLIAMRMGKEEMRRRCRVVGLAIMRESGVQGVTHRNRLTGRAYVKQRYIDAPEPTTRRRLYVFAHECGHVALAHNRSTPAYIKEYEAEQYAHAALRRHGIAVPRKETDRAKRYVALKIHRAVRRGQKKPLDKKILKWCGDHLSKETRQWLAAHARWQPRCT